MISKSIEDITISDIKVLIENEVPERRTLDYKQQIPKDDKDGTKAFLADICSFANTIGGDLIYGIKEERDENGKTTGIPEEICQLADINFDDFQKRYEDKIQAGIEPRIQGIQFRQITYADNKYILIIRVPQSWAAPHRVIISKMSHFYGRRNAGNYQLDINEIRSTFLSSETVTSRIEKFVEDRINRIIDGNTPVKLRGRSSVILHVVPLSSFTSSNYLDLENIQYENPPAPMENHGIDSRYNFYGFLKFIGNQDESYAYAQLFRNGIIESVSNIFVSDHKGKNGIEFSYCEKQIISALKQYIEFHKSKGFTVPIFVFLSIINVSNCKIITDNFTSAFRTTTMSENNLLLPGVTIREINEKPESVLRPLFDSIWQAGGYNKCFNYDENGNYKYR